jgi:hypothetical protein
MRDYAIVLICLVIVSALIFAYVSDKGAIQPTGGLIHSSRTTLVILIVFCTFILYNIFAGRAGRELFIRKIPGLAAIDEALGRATEMGRPIMFNYGIAALDIDTLQAMVVLSHVTRQVAKFGAKVIVPAVDPQVMAVTEGILREAYAEEGKEELFSEDDIRFLSGEQFAFAAGCIGIMNREKVAAQFLIGVYAAESLLLAEAGQQIGAIQVAGTPYPDQIPFFVAACDYTIIGDEYYAASAYLSKEPTLLGSLRGQDVGKFLFGLIVTLAILLGSIATYPAIGGWAKAALKFLRIQLGARS